METTFAAPGGPGTLNWTTIGPSVVAHGQATTHPPVSGRIEAIAVGPAGTRVYAGSANGGVWFSSDSGATWSPLDEYAKSPSYTSGLEADSLSVGSLAVRFGASSATDQIFVGTGEPGSDGYFGVGIKFSSQGGAQDTWTLEATNLAGCSFYRVVIDPDNSGSVYAATSIGLYRRPAAAPFTNWTQITSPAFTDSNAAVSDVVVAVTGATKNFYAAFENGQVYSSPDTVTWTPVAGLSGTGRTVLAAAESDPSVVYAFAQNGKLYRLVASAFQEVTGLPTVFVGNQGYYDIAVAVDPADANTVYLVGDLLWDGNDWNLSFWKGTITGGPGSYVFPFNSANAANPSVDPTWIGQDVHPDGHCLVFALNATGTAHDGTNVWVGTDGGVFQSTDSGANDSFVARNTGLAITQLTYLAQRPDTDAVVFAGCQDNGNLRFWGDPVWVEAPEGDGGGVAVSPFNQMCLMRQYHSAGSFDEDANFLGGLSTCTDGGISGNWSTLQFPPWTANTPQQRAAVNKEDQATAFYGPIAVPPPQPGINIMGSGRAALFGTNRVWFTYTWDTFGSASNPASAATEWGVTWVTLPTGTNPYSAATPDATQDVLDGTSIRALAMGQDYSPIFAATASAVWRFDSEGRWPTLRLTPIPTVGLPPNRVITALAVEDWAAGTFYVALGGGGNQHVWYFDGSAWHGAGPDVTELDAPCHAIVVDPAKPQIVYLGSDVGCWKGTKTGASTWSWALFSDGLPEAAITDLAIHARARLLRAATHGRGAWEIPIDASATQDPDIYLRADIADTGRVTGGTRFPWIDSAPDPTISDGSQHYVFHWTSPDIKIRRPSVPDLPPLGSNPNYLDFTMNVGEIVLPNSVGTADKSGSNRIFVQVHNRGVTPLSGSEVYVLLLICDAGKGRQAGSPLPPLGSGYADHINSQDSNPSWLGPNWYFADPANPYRTLPGVLSARTPQVVEYDVNFANVPLFSAPSALACIVAFVTTPSDRLTSTITNFDDLTMRDKRVAYRSLTLL